MGLFNVLDLDLTGYIWTNRDLSYIIKSGSSLQSKLKILFWEGRV